MFYSPLLCFHFGFAQVFFLVLSCIKRKKHRLKENENHVIRVKIPSGQDLCDAAQDAKNRHDAQSDLFPSLHLQTKSITNSNYHLAKTEFGFLPHEKIETCFVQPTVLPSTRLTFADTCLVYVVYGNDDCRGEIEKEENTIDPHPPEAGQEVMVHAEENGPQEQHKNIVVH
ncbi:hypothetical protein DdX_12210 [Ditylenchus destructor]|uniref:Uncharacterized protein n=1 Tax=Ditylenchus destructor TaxID=166010 RepID=A0AAD4MXQ3_9BILA|nr:hypothetical protein DdX_12210 [Ditylenchus destructor]